MDELSVIKVNAAVPVNAAHSVAPQPPAQPNRSAAEFRVTEVDMEEAAGQLKELAAQHSVNLNFSVHEKTGRTVIRVVDSNTNEVVRVIPPEEVLDLMATMEEIAGKLVNKKA